MTLTIERPIRPAVQLVVLGLVHAVLAVHRHQWPVLAIATALLALLVVLSRRGWADRNVAVAYSAVVLSVVADLDTAFTPAILVFLVPMIWLVRDLPDQRRVLAYGLWSGVLIAAGATSWLWEVMTSFWEFPVVVSLFIYAVVSIVMGLQFALFMVIARWLVDRTKLNLGLMAPLAYIIAEYWMPIPFPMQLSMATAWAPTYFQTADLFGMPGVSLVLAGINAALFSVLDGLVRRRSRQAAVAAAVGLLIAGLHFGYGYLSLRRYEPREAQGGVHLAMVQPMSPLKILNADTRVKQTVAQKLAHMSREAITSAPLKVDLLVWPEGAAPFAYGTPQFNPEFVEVIRSFQKEFPVPMTFQDIEFAPGDELRRVRYYNHVSSIGPDGSYLGGYRKNHPLPFAEYLPGESTFPWLRRLFPKARSVVPGEAPTLLPAPGGPSAPLICYEILDADYVRRFVNLGARYIVNYTNDRYYGPTQQPLQHLLFAVFRAVENRRPVVRSTNSGISAYIDARGVIAPGSRTGVMEEALLHGTIYPRDGQTIYGRWGDWLPRWVVTPCFLGLAGYVLMRQFRERRLAGQRSMAAPKSESRPHQHRRRRQGRQGDQGR